MRLLCKILGHHWSLFKARRERPSVVHQVRCQRCGVQRGAIA